MGFNWSPGIGDPSFVGWLTVALYLVAAAASYAVVVKLRRQSRDWEQDLLIWRAFLLILVLLGINKQLDLHSALTELGRYIARHQGWYENRRNVQVIFVGILAAAAVAGFMSCVVLMRNTSWPTLIALFGGGLVLTFVVIRAASFHHADEFLSRRLAGVRWHAVLEMGGLLIVLTGAWLRWSLTPPARQP